MCGHRTWKSTLWKKILQQIFCGRKDQNHTIYWRRTYQNRKTALSWVPESTVVNFQNKVADYEEGRRINSIPPIEQEIVEAITRLKIERAPWSDNIPGSISHDYSKLSSFPNPENVAKQIYFWGLDERANLKSPKKVILLTEGESHLHRALSRY